MKYESQNYIECVRYALQIYSELTQGFAKRIRDAAEMGDVTTLRAIAAEI